MTKTDKKVRKVKNQAVSSIRKHLQKKNISIFEVVSDKLSADYDFVIEEDGILKKVKCQVGWMDAGSVNFWTTKAAHKDIDLVYVYVPKWEKIYKVPSPIAISTGGTLRFMPVIPRRYTFAKDYEE